MAIHESIMNWFTSLDNSYKYLFKDESEISQKLQEDVDFLDLLSTKKYFSKNMLRDTLSQKSRVVMFGAGGTASWFLPKLLKIYNDAFTKCPDLKYDLEIVIIDGDDLEHKNIVRQNFIYDDIGEKKALKLAERYNDLYPHISVSAIPMYATSTSYDTEISKLETPLDPEHFFNIDSFLNRTDIVVNLVDNEIFKRKLDHVIFKRVCMLYFNAGINLFNGQCYVTYPRHTNLYTIDHPSFIDDVEEVSVHSCADADVQGTDDNPEQMFNGNDLAASLLANLYQTAITETITHRKIKFVCGNNISISKELPTFSSILYARSLAPNRDYPVDEANAFIARHGKDEKSKEAIHFYDTLKAVDVYYKVLNAVSESLYEH